MPFLISKTLKYKPRDVLSREPSLFYIHPYQGQLCSIIVIMKTKLSLRVRLRIEVDTTKNAKSKICKYLIFGRIVKVLFHLIDAIGRLYKMIGLNR